MWLLTAMVSRAMHLRELASCDFDLKGTITSQPPHMPLSLKNKLFVELRNIILELNGELYFLSLLVATLS